MLIMYYSSLEDVVEAATFRGCKSKRRGNFTRSATGNLNVVNSHFKIVLKILQLKYEIDTQKTEH